MKKERDSRFELLRIVSMIFIICGHYAYHGFSNDFDVYSRSMKSSILFTSIGGQVGVNIFVMISGYFGIDNKINIKDKIKNLANQVWFYSYFIYVILLLLGICDFSLHNAYIAFLPIISKEYWFATAWIVLVLLMNIINSYFRKLSKISYKRILIVCMIVWVIIPTFLYGNMYENELIWFSVLYILGGYLKKFEISISKTKCLIYGVFCWIICWMSGIVISYIGETFTIFKGKEFYFMGGNKLPIVATSIFIFMFINKCAPFYNNKINDIGKTMFAVYLVHDNYFIRNVLWQYLKKFFSINNSIKFNEIGLIVILFVLSIGFVTEKLRKVICVILRKEFYKYEFIKKCKN